MTRTVAATALLVLAVLAAAATTPWAPAAPELPTLLRGNPADMPSIPPQPEATPGPPADQYLDPDARGTLGIVLAVVLLALLGWILAALGRRLRDRYLPPVDPAAQVPTAAGSVTTGTDPLTTELHDAVRQAQHAVDRARGVPRDAVVAAWVALEDAAADHGTGRDPADTPTEFTSALLAATPAPPADITTLRDLYQRARFTSRPVTDDDVETARAALAGIARALDPARTP